MLSNIYILTLLALASTMPMIIAFELAHHYSSLSLLDDSLYNYHRNSTHKIGDNKSNNADGDDNDDNDNNVSDDLIFIEGKLIEAITSANQYHHDPIYQYNNMKNEQINCKSVDFTDFIALIPIAEVQETVYHYYRQDKEVQRAIAYFQSKDFIQLKEKILNIHEVDEFLKYLNRSGLEAIKFFDTLTNLFGDPEQFEQTQFSGSGESETTTEIAENMKGLHGLVDRILDLFPQDQVLSLFFDKMETSEEFSKFVELIGSEEFNRILEAMKNSSETRMLVNTLNNNGILVTRIVDSLKAYFFLA